jgi:hypothetical protein
MSIRIEPIKYFFILKGPCSVNHKKPVSASLNKKCGVLISMGRPLQIVDSGKPIQTMAKRFPAFLAGNQFSDF